MKNQKIIKIIESDAFAAWVGGQDESAVPEIGPFRCWLRSDTTKGCQQRETARVFIAWMQKILS